MTRMISHRLSCCDDLLFNKECLALLLLIHRLLKILDLSTKAPVLIKVAEMTFHLFEYGIETRFITFDLTS